MTESSDRETLEHVLAVTGQHSERVRVRARALLSRAQLRLDGMVSGYTNARSDLSQLLGEVRNHKPRVIASEDRPSVVLITVDDFLSIVSLTDPEAKASSLGRLPAGLRPAQMIDPRDDLQDDVSDERAAQFIAESAPLQVK